MYVSALRNIKLNRKQMINAIAISNEKYASPISNIPAPIARGMNNKKENLIAFSLDIPENNAAEIVIPDLEIPGNNANNWNNPMTKAFL